MAVKELTVEEKLKALYELQKIDSKIDEIQVLKGELPMEVQDLEDELIGLQTRIDKIKSSIDEYNAEIAKYRNIQKEAEILILKYEKQQDNVKNNREYEALMKEIELQRLEIQLASKKTRGSEALIAEKETVYQEAKERLEVKSKALEDKKVELEKIIKDTDKEEKDLIKRTEKARKKIEDRLLKPYDKTRKNYRNGLAVVMVERLSCGGCFNKVPPQLQIEVGQRKKIIVCEHCGRILVDPEIDVK